MYDEKAVGKLQDTIGALDMKVLLHRLGWMDGYLDILIYLFFEFG